MKYARPAQAAPGREVVERIEVRLRGVVDVGGVDEVLAVADEAQPAGARALDQARQQLVVARAPDQARAQRDGRERRVVGGEHCLLGDRLGGRVRAP